MSDKAKQKRYAVIVLIEFLLRFLFYNFCITFFHIFFSHQLNFQISKIFILMKSNDNHYRK